MALNDILILPNEKIEGLKDNDEKSFETDKPEGYQTNRYVLLQNPNEKDIAEIQIKEYNKSKKMGIFKVIRIFNEKDREILGFLKRFDPELYANQD